MGTTTVNQIKREVAEHVFQLKETVSMVSPSVSFEFFPPKTEEMEHKLWQTIEVLAPLGPEFVSVTYGAGGSTRERTHATIARILKQTKLTPAAHLTCVGSTREEVDAIAKSYFDLGVKHIVALRGDMPELGARYTPLPGGYAYADDLVAGLKKVGDFTISVAAYPETHPEALSPVADIEHLKRKIDAGATNAITQFFFDNEVYFSFIERVQKAGIHAPIIPGILPVTNFNQAVKFSKQCGATIPSWMVKLFEGLDDHPDTRHLVAAIVAVEQVRLLQKAGVTQFHFYTLNRAELTMAICHILGIRSRGE